MEKPNKIYLKLLLSFKCFLFIIRLKKDQRFYTICWLIYVLLICIFFIFITKNFR